MVVPLVYGLCCFCLSRKVQMSEGRLQLKLLPASAGEGNGNPFQYSCLENPKDGGAWKAAVPGVTKS